MDRDLPDGVIDAAPPGGWESGETAGTETDQRSADAAGVPSLAESERADDADRTSGNTAGGPSGTASDAFVASAEIQQGMDPDLSTDEQAEQ